MMQRVDVIIPDMFPLLDEGYLKSNRLPCQQLDDDIDQLTRNDDDLTWGFITQKFLDRR